MNAEWEVQKAIFAKLDTDLAVPVFDFVPQQNPPPTYVTIGEDTLLPFNTDGIKGFEGTLIIHSWDSPRGGDSGGDGRKLIKLLQGEIYDSLDRAELVITGYDPIGIDFEFSQTSLDPDGITYHGVQRFRLLITEQ